MIKIEAISCSWWLSLKVIFLRLIFSFSFLFYGSFLWIITACAYNPCSVAYFFTSDLISFGTFWGLFGLFLHWYKTYVGNICFASKYEFSITSYIGLQNVCFLLEIFSTYTFNVSWYFKVFFSYSIVTTMSLFLSSTLFASAFTAASSLAYSATFYYSSCNKSGLTPPPRNWLFHCISSYTSLYVINNWRPFK